MKCSAVQAVQAVQFNEVQFTFVSKVKIVVLTWCRLQVDWVDISRYLLAGDKEKILDLSRCQMHSVIYYCIFALIHTTSTGPVVGIFWRV